MLQPEAHQPEAKDIEPAPDAKTPDDDAPLQSVPVPVNAVSSMLQSLFDAMGMTAADADTPLNGGMTLGDLCRAAADGLDRHTKERKVAPLPTWLSTEAYNAERKLEDDGRQGLLLSIPLDVLLGYGAAYMRTQLDLAMACVACRIGRHRRLRPNARAVMTLSWNPDSDSMPESFCISLFA